MKFLVLLACVAYASASLVHHPGGAVTPPETPSVVAAKAAHFAAKGAHAYGPVAAIAPIAPIAPLAHGYAAGYAHRGLVAHPNGAVVPVDEPAVQAAKADHFAAKGAFAPAIAHGAAYAAPALAYGGAYSYAHAPALAYGGAYAPALTYAHAHAPAVGYAHGYGFNYSPLVTYPNGAVVPADEPAVAAAKAKHFKALAAAH